jgi:hypothetical protein
MTPGAANGLIIRRPFAPAFDQCLWERRFGIILSWKPIGDSASIRSTFGGKTHRRKCHCDGNTAYGVYLEGRAKKRSFGHGCREPEISPIRFTRWSDFTDWFRARRPAANRMRSWIPPLLSFAACAAPCRGEVPPAPAPGAYDVVIVGGTPGGIMAAVAAARGGRTAVLLERTAHVGGLPANGLGATDIATRGATGGLFLEFVGRVRAHYAAAYGEGSPQVKDCSDGYHFEPSVAERIFEAMLAEHPSVAVRRGRQFDARPEHVTLDGARLAAIRVTDLATRAVEAYAAKVFIDATYEGDLAAAAGAPFRVGREGKEAYDEPMAGKLYKAWGGPVGEGSTGEADRAVQAFNYRLCLTTRPDNRLPIPKPAAYRRDEYASLADDVRLDRATGKPGREKAWDGIGRVVNLVTLPNGKTDANNQHLAFLSTDLPEENAPWPTADWAWRDRYAARLRDYTLGLLWFCQNDPALPEDFRARCAAWGLAKDEYADNGNFPRQVYVREGRRIEGERLFTAHDALPAAGSERPPLHADSVTASHYALDSHAVRKREPGRVHLDGFFSHPTKPYTVPYGVIVPKRVEGLLTPVPVSGTHVGFSTMRMEPCWMALGQAAGTAAAIAVADGVPARKVDVVKLQRELLRQKAILIYYTDVPPGHAAFEAVQSFGLRGFLPGWEAKPGAAVGEEEAARWAAWADVGRPAGAATRGAFLTALYESALALPPDRLGAIRAR